MKPRPADAAAALCRIYADDTRVRAADVARALVNVPVDHPARLVSCPRWRGASPVPDAVLGFSYRVERGLATPEELRAFAEDLQAADDAAAFMAAQRVRYA